MSTKGLLVLTPVIAAAILAALVALAVGTGLVGTVNELLGPLGF